MKPENVKPAKFYTHTIIYNNESFSVAYGIWEQSEKRLATRWNGKTDNDTGYPNQGGNPVWFQLPNDSIWESEILQAVDRIKAFEEKIKSLDAEL